MVLNTSEMGGNLSSKISPLCLIKALKQTHFCLQETQIDCLTVVAMLVQFQSDRTEHQFYKITRILSPPLKPIEDY